MLILTSEFADVADKLLARGFLHPKKKKVAFVQNATDDRQATGEIISWVESAKDRYRDTGYYLDILDLRVVQGEKLYTTLQQYDYLHIHGGDNEYLHHVCQAAGLFDCIHSLVQNGLIYIGSSAGSLMAGPDITYACAQKGQQQLKGFGLHPFYFGPHFGSRDRKQIRLDRLNYCWEHQLSPYVSLSNTQALVFEDGKYIFVG